MISREDVADFCEFYVKKMASVFRRVCLLLFTSADRLNRYETPRLKPSEKPTDSRINREADVKGESTSFFERLKIDRDETLSR